MLKKSLVSLLLVSATLLSTTTAMALPDFLEPINKVGEKIKRQIAKQKIGGSLDIIDLDIFDGLSTALKYKIESEPSYIDGYYTRLDRYQFSIDINPGSIWDDDDATIGFGIHKGNEVIFARQFKSQKESLLATPYTYKNIPLTSQKALRNMNVGDFVALEGSLSLTLGLGAGDFLNKYAELRGSTHVYVSGDFYIHIFKMSETKMRVKLISSRGKGAGASGKLEIGDDLKIVGFSYLDRKIKRIINTKPISVEIGKGKRDLFMVDYVFDLNQTAAAQAYDDLFTKKSRFKDIALINPFESRSDMEKALLNDLSNIENISYEDRTLPQDQRRIDRIFRGSSTADISHTKIKLGINLFRIEDGAASASNRVIYMDRDNQESKYLLDTFTVKKSMKYFFGMFGHETVNSTNLLYQSNDNWTPEKFVALTLSKDIKMKTVSEYDMGRVQKYVRGLIPMDQYRQIDWKNWKFPRYGFVNGFFRVEMFFQPEAVQSLPRMPEREAYKLIKQYVMDTGHPSVNPHGYKAGDYRPPGHWINRYEEDLMFISRDMAALFKARVTSEERYTAFKRLARYPLWQERGQGFLLSLLPKEHREKLVSFKMTFTAKDADAINYEFGNFEKEELYRSLMYIQGILENRSFDLRLISPQGYDHKLQ